jgi:hypothetical protein
VTVWNLLEANTIGVPHFLTTITVHQNIFIIVLAAILARCFIFVVVGNLKEHGWIQVGYLGFFFDGIGGQNGA